MNAQADRQEILIPLTAEHLGMLAWLAEWTPEVHRASWRVRRTWPPGFREVADTSVQKRPEEEMAITARLARPPFKNGPSITSELLAYRLAEGTWRCARLTARGRAALKFNGLACPDSFESHCIDIFDPFSLLGPGEDNESAWRAELVEYRDKDYQGRHTLTKATASLTTCSSRGTHLNGSIRRHDRFLSLEVRNAEGHHVLEAWLSFEALSELLTTHSLTPVTLGSYFGTDGMRRCEPAPPAVSASRRMVERLQNADDVREQRIRDVRAKIAKANIGKRLQDELLWDLDIAASAESDRAFAVEQAAEEVSIVVESALSIVSKRYAAAGLAPPVLPATAALALGAPVPDRKILQLTPWNAETWPSREPDPLADSED